MLTFTKLTWWKHTDQDKKKASVRNMKNRSNSEKLPVRNNRSKRIKLTDSKAAVHNDTKHYALNSTYLETNSKTAELK